jgi:hypothetical protein
MFLTIVPISDTVGNPTESTTVDGINLAEIKENATFNNISVISWWSILLVEETGGPRENHRPVTSH